MIRRITDIFPLSSGLKQTFQKGYGFKDFISDMQAAFVVSMIALPLSMALAIAIGLPPQHGIYTAIVAGIAAAVFGGSLYQISGPTAAFVVIILPIVSEFGLRGIIWCQILAGIMLIFFAVIKVGRLINYIPYPVTTGFTTGIALVLATISLNDFFGLRITELNHHFIDKLSSVATHLPNLNRSETAIGIITILFIIWARRYLKWLPAPIIGVLGGTLLGTAFSHFGSSIATIGTEFSYSLIDGTVLNGVPPFPPQLHFPTFEAGGLLSIPTLAELKTFFIPSFIIATLAALESLMSASIADSLTSTRHHSNCELNGIGIANILSGLATGIPATAALARTATNIHNGAKSPFAAVIHSLLILIYVLLLSPLIGLIPMSVLAALLLITAYHMSHLRQFTNTLRIAPKADRLVLLTCFFLTVFIDMIAGVSVGIILAALLFLKRIAANTHVHLETPKIDEDLANHPELPKEIMLFRIEGPLFFGTVEKAYDRTMIINSSIKTLIIDLEKVPVIDMTGMVAMQSVLASISKNRCVYLCGQPSIVNKILRKLSPEIIQRLKTTLTVANAIEQILIASPTLEGSSNPISIT